MAPWCRVKQSQLRNLSNQFKRCYFQIHGPCPVTIHITSHTKIYGLTKQDPVFLNTQFEFCKNVRFFAAPAKFKPKQEEEEDHGPRLNEKITSQFIRLVLDEGHNIVSRREALERAKNLKLDLVEVDRNAKPPVCKIMDFHREKYNQQLKDKERAKSKTAGALRKGEFKSVHFEGKIEQKDLQMKAATVKRMMDNGYRVKCLAKVSDKKAMANEDENLSGLLARFCAMIEDVSVIESGPLMEKKGAYVVVRHVKYGLPKKGPKKNSVLEAINNHVEKDSDSEAAIDPVNESPLLDDPTPTSHPPKASLEIENRYKKHPRSSPPPSTEMNFVNPLPENRYKKNPINRSSPTETNFPSADPRRLQPQYPSQGRQPPQYPNQGRPTQQYPNQGRQEQQFPNQGRPTQQYPNLGRQAQQFSNQGRPVQTDPSTWSQPREARQGQTDVSNGPEPNSNPEPQPTEVNRYKKAANQNSRVSNFHGSRGQGR